MAENNGNGNGNGAPDHIWRAVGRIEQRVNEIGERGTASDAELKELKQYQHAQAHKINNALQSVSNQVTDVQNTTKKQALELQSIGRRVGALEAPVKRLAQVKAQRRKVWIKIVSVASFVGTVVAFLWQLAEPIWKALAPTFVQRWFAG